MEKDLAQFTKNVDLMTHEEVRLKLWELANRMRDIAQAYEDGGEV